MNSINIFEFLIGKKVHLALMPNLYPISSIGFFEGKPIILGISDPLVKPGKFIWLELMIEDYKESLDEISLLFKTSKNSLLKYFEFNNHFKNQLKINAPFDKLPTILTLFSKTIIKKITFYREDALNFLVLIEHSDNQKWFVHGFDWNININFYTEAIKEIENATDYQEIKVYE